MHDEDLSAYLERAALAYLERYSSSADNLRRVLKRKLIRRLIRRGAEDAAATAEAHAPRIETVVTTLQTRGLVDDAAYAEAKARAERRQGRSARAIAARLRAKGVSEQTVAAALRASDEGTADAEFAAALRLARKRRIGPFGPAQEPKEHDKQLARLARAGFSLDICRQVLALDLETAEDRLYDRF